MKAHIGLVALVVAPAILAVPMAASAAPLTAYDDQLRNGFADWSWATHSL